MKFKNPEGQLSCWLETLSEYDMDIVHRPGAQHRNADALSRIPCKQCGYYVGWEHGTENVHSSVHSCTEQNDNNDIKTTEDLKQLQDKDKDTAFVKECLSRDVVPPFEEISGKGYLIRSLLAQLQKLKVIDGILYRHFLGDNKTKDRFQAVIPFSSRRTVLHYIFWSFQITFQNGQKVFQCQIWKQRQLQKSLLNK